MKNQKEEFRDIPNYEGLYQVSDLGRVKSLSRTVWIPSRSCYKTIKGRFLTKSDRGNGYLRVCLCLNGKEKTKHVHQLVAIAFLNHKPDGFNIVVDHIDGDKHNNHLSNLQLLTTRQNLSKGRTGCYSKHTGVSKSNSIRNKWVSIIYSNGRNIHLGFFKTELEASKTYQKALLNLDKYNGNNKDFRDYLKSL